MTIRTRGLLPVLGWSLLGVLTLLLAMSLQFRLPPGMTAPFAIDANLPRWLAGFAGGALLALAGSRLDERTASPFFWITLSTGAVAGCVAGFLTLGAAGAIGGLAAGAGTGLFVGRRFPAHGYLPALAGLLLAGLGLYLASLVKTEPSLGRTLTWWAAGDTGQATLPLGLIACSLLALLLGLRVVDRWPWLCLGLGMGLIGPAGFLAWWVPLAERRLTRLDGLPRDCMLAFAGGVVMVTVDATQRWLIGGYGLGLNFPLALVGTPVWLWWIASRRGGWQRHAGRIGAVLVALLACAFTAFTVATIRSAT